MARRAPRVGCRRLPAALSQLSLVPAPRSPASPISHSVTALVLARCERQEVARASSGLVCRRTSPKSPPSGAFEDTDWAIMRARHPPTEQDSDKRSRSTTTTAKFRRRSRAATSRRPLFLLLLGAAIATAALLALTLALLPSPDLLLPTDPPLDAVVVLGYALKRGKPTPALRRRIKSGVKLWHSGRAAHLVFSGGAPTRRRAKAAAGDGSSEAAVMARAALRELRRLEEGGEEAGEEAALPPQWLLETRSTSTRENALETLALASERGWASLAVATNRWHAPRAVLTFRRAAAAGDVARIVAVIGEEDDDDDEDSLVGQMVAWASETCDATVRETAAALLYRARGWL